MNPAAKNCTVTRIGRLWDAILVTDDGFGALMCQKCVQSQIRLGEWAGGGGSANREPGSYDPGSASQSSPYTLWPKYIL